MIGNNHPGKPTKSRKPRASRRLLMVQLNDAEREKLEWLRANRGDRATLSGVVRELVLAARK
jgi:hypothetical protein